jgi:sporulation protein YlmC with PRC-barrel domain
MTETQDATLYTLGDRGETVDGMANDVRGRHVKDKNGDSIGKVSDLLMDDREHTVRFLLVDHGGFLGFGAKESLIPVDAITEITELDVSVDQSREHIAAAPGYSPDLVDDRPYHSSIYNHYGYGPFWGAGYMYPGGLVSPRTPGRWGPTKGGPRM